MTTTAAIQSPKGVSELRKVIKKYPKGAKRGKKTLALIGTGGMLIKRKC